jgi:hypothetical protein
MGRVIPLTTHNAEIKTATVEIRTLTVTGKQVTLAVFRQLEESPLINHDGSLNGVAWGRVNYCPGKTCPVPDHHPHWHVVWQQGTELRRSAIKKEVGTPSIASPSEDMIITALAVGAITGAREWSCGFRLEDALDAARREGRFCISVDGVGILLCLPKRLWDLRQAWRGWQDAERGNERAQKGLEATEASRRLGDPVEGLKWARENAARHAEMAAAAKSALDSALAWFEAEGYMSQASLAAWHEAAKKDREAELERRKRHAEARKAIESLPQLFIAV